MKNKVLQKQLDYLLERTVQKVIKENTMENEQMGGISVEEFITKMEEYREKIADLHGDIMMYTYQFEKNGNMKNYERKSIYNELKNTVSGLDTLSTEDTGGMGPHHLQKNLRYFIDNLKDEYMNPGLNDDEDNF